MAEVREPLRPLIARLRREVGDEGTDPMWTESELAEALEEYSCVVRYLPLRPHQTRLPNGTVQDLDFESGTQWWETDAIVVNGSWTTVTPTSFDHVRGRVSFASHQVSALYISGKHYDLYRAAENVIDQSIAKLKRRAIDMSDTNGSLKRNQQIQTLLELKRGVQAKQTPGTGHMVRSDV